MKRKILILIVACFILIVSTVSFAGKNKKFQSFNKAKKISTEKVYYDHRETFYCGCEFDRKNNIIDRNGYIPKSENKRAQRVEWEHIVPAHAFGQSFKEWRDGHPDCVDRKGKSFKGRACAGKVNVKFRYMESDLYNLVPVVGEINGLRLNYSFAMIPGKSDQFGRCKIKIKDRKVEPPPDVRGDIARIYMYMHKTYPSRGIISLKNRKLFMAWDKQDPIDEWECKRCKRIKGIQKNYNPIVEKQCIRNQLW